MLNIKKNSSFRRIGIISFVVATLASIPSLFSSENLYP